MAISQPHAMAVNMDAISKTLGTEQGMVPLERPVKTDYELTTASDVTQARNNLKELIDQAMDQVPSMLDFTQSSQDSKMYSAAAQFLAVVSEMNTKLSKINAPNKPGTSAQPGGSTVPQTVTNQQVFVGSTEDLLKMMSKNNQSVLLEPAPVAEGEFLGR